MPVSSLCDERMLRGTEGVQHRTVSSRLTGAILNLLFDCFLFQIVQLSSHLFSLVAKLVDALSQGKSAVLAGGYGRCLGLNNYRRSRLSRQIGQGLVEGVTVYQPVAHSQYDLLELGHAGFGGLNVNRLEVKEAASHGESDDASPQHVRPLLVPQREVFGNILVLINA